MLLLVSWVLGISEFNIAVSVCCTVSHLLLGVCCSHHTVLILYTTSILPTISVLCTMLVLYYIIYQYCVLC